MTRPLTFILLLTAVLLPDGRSAQAQTFPPPNRVITLVVGYPAGGGVDVMARALAHALTRQLGTAVTVENRPGAGGAISVQTVARADPDGHTLYFGSLSELAVRQAAMRVAYDLDRDLAPISLVGVTPIALVVHSSLPVKTLAEFKALAKSTPDGLIYGSPGQGTLMHFAGEALRVKLDVPIKHLAYRGAAPLANDLAGGHVTVGMSGLPPIVPLAELGTVRLIATSSAERSALTPDVASFAEAGVSGVDIANYVGLAAPKKTPIAVLQKLEAGAVAACKSPELAATLQRNSASAICADAAEYKSFIDRERAQQLELIRATNFNISE
jgi:tripartite-type tricarboxylate transporter receptor subunit TctC